MRTINRRKEKIGGEWKERRSGEMGYECVPRLESLTVEVGMGIALFYLFGSIIHQAGVHR
jgi:hypothetical protein